MVYVKWVLQKNMQIWKIKAYMSEGWKRSYNNPNPLKCDLNILKICRYSLFYWSWAQRGQHILGGKLKYWGKTWSIRPLHPSAWWKKFFLGGKWMLLRGCCPLPPPSYSPVSNERVFLNKIGQVATTQIFLKPTKFHGSMKKNLCQVPGPQLLPNSLHTPKNIDFIIWNFFLTAPIYKGSPIFYGR